MEERKELFCPKCQWMTMHEFKYHIMDVQEQRATEERAMDELEKEGIGGRLAVRLLRWDPVRRGKEVADEIWDVIDPSGLRELQGKDVYVCTVCGNEKYV